MKTQTVRTISTVENRHRAEREAETDRLDKTYVPRR
jgi:hypothetical protein